MKLRPARAIDAPRLADLLQARFPETRYAEASGLDMALARRTFAHAAQRHGHTNDGGTFLMLAEADDGEIDAFIMGVLGRTYLVGTTLTAQDYFLLGRKDCSPRALPALQDAFLAWAMGNPRVVEIMTTWTDILPGAERIERAWARKGFERCGGIMRRFTPAQPEELAA